MDAVASAQAGFVTGASARNWASYGADIRLSCSVDAVQNVLETFARHGFAQAAIVGSVAEGTAGVDVEP